MTARRLTIGILIMVLAVWLIACGSESASDTPAAQSDDTAVGSSADSPPAGNGSDGDGTPTQSTSGDEASLALFSCAGVLGPASDGITLTTRDATSPASADNPAVESMCMATWEKSEVGGEFLTASVVTFTTNEAAAAHFKFTSSEFEEGLQTEGLQAVDGTVGSGPEILGAEINQGGIGSMVISRDHRVLVSVHSGPETTSETAWNVDFLMETAASIIEKTPAALRAD